MLVLGQDPVFRSPENTPLFGVSSFALAHAGPLGWGREVVSHLPGLLTKVAVLALRENKKQMWKI